MTARGERRTRALHVITNLGFGGAERLVVSAARGLPADRYESAICCFSERGPLATEAERQGIAVHCLGAFPGAANPDAFVRLLRLVASWKPDIVHTHLQSPNLYGRIAAIVSRVPAIVASEHNVYTNKAGRYVALERVLARSTGAIVAVSEEVRRFLAQQLGVAPSRIRVIHNGVAVPAPLPSGVAQIERQTGGEAAALRIATVASLTAKKGHIILLRALAQLRARGVNVTAIFAGDGPERSNLDSAVSALGLDGTVHFLGATDRVGDVLAAVDVFVLPSLVEGLPLALLEAMHAGKPVVATAVGGVPEAISAGDNGLLVPSMDAAALADALAGLAASPEQRARLGHRARETAAARFSEQSYIDALAALYAELLAS